MTRPLAPPKEEFDYRYTLAAGIGVVGGATIGYWAFDHAFGRGMTKEEKTQIAGFGMALGLVYLASQTEWGQWLTVEGIGNKVDALLQEAKL